MVSQRVGSEPSMLRSVKVTCPSASTRMTVLVLKEPRAHVPSRKVQIGGGRGLAGLQPGSGLGALRPSASGPQGGGGALS